MVSPRITTYGKSALRVQAGNCFSVSVRVAGRGVEEACPRGWLRIGRSSSERSSLIFAGARSIPLANRRHDNERQDRTRERVAALLIEQPHARSRPFLSLPVEVVRPYGSAVTDRRQYGETRDPQRLDPLQPDL